MTIETAVLSFYLLFPLWSGQQEQLASACGRKLMPRNRELVVSSLENFLAHPEDAHHDPALVAGDAAAIDTASIPNLMARLGLYSGEQPFYDGGGRLRSHELGVEKASWGSREAGAASVYANDRQFVQSVRDEQSRVVEKTVWRNAKESKNIRLLRRLRYRYTGDSQIPASLEDENLEGQTVTMISYDAAGRIAREQEYVIWGGRRHAGQSRSCSYDAQGRLIAESSSAGANGTPATRTRYVYTAASSKPDSFYYEDGMLRTKTEYSAENDWLQTTYFSSHYSIAARYRNGVKVSESVYSDGTLQRTRSYE